MRVVPRIVGIAMALAAVAALAITVHRFDGGDGPYERLRRVFWVAWTATGTLGLVAGFDCFRYRAVARKEVSAYGATSILVALAWLVITAIWYGSQLGSLETAWAGGTIAWSIAVFALMARRSVKLACTT